MNYLGIGERPPGAMAPLVLRLAIALAAGAGAGLAAFALSYYQLGRTLGTDDVAKALGGGIGCLVPGIMLMCRPIKGLDWLRSILVALLLGTGMAFSILSFFSWMKWVNFVHDRHPNLKYLIGEVGGYSGPGLGLLTCGIVMFWSYSVWLDNERRSLFGAGHNVSLPAAPRPQRQMLGFLLRLALASILGAGAGLLNGAMTNIILGIRGSLQNLSGL